MKISCNNFIRCIFILAFVNLFPNVRGLLYVLPETWCLLDDVLNDEVCRLFSSGLYITSLSLSLSFEFLQQFSPYA
jgi:hypothetical protein